jgi:hypothetical protein
MYYIYIYLDPLKPGNYSYQDFFFNYEPFYVGRGKNNRYKVHIQKYKLNSKNNKNSRIKNIMGNNLKPIIYFSSTGITFENSLILEKEAILKIGREKLNTGPLTNLTSGGQGVLGMTLSEESINKMKNTCLERGIYKKFSENMKGDKNSMSGKKWHRSDKGILNFKNKMTGVSPLIGKTTSEKRMIFNKTSETLKGHQWSDIEKEKRKLGMEKVWKYRKENNITIDRNTFINVKIIDISKNEELLFQTIKKAAEYLNVHPTTIKRRYENNKIVNNIKIQLITK